MKIKIPLTRKSQRDFFIQFFSLIACKLKKCVKLVLSVATHNIKSLLKQPEIKIIVSSRQHHCDPDGIQTHDLRNRNPTFYSAELRGRGCFTGLTQVFSNIEAMHRLTIAKVLFFLHPAKS